MQRRMVLGGLMAMAASTAGARGEDRPRVVSTVPADGDLDVDPALASFTVVFDRPMRRSCSFVTKGDAPMPGAGPPELVDDEVEQVIHFVAHGGGGKGGKATQLESPTVMETTSSTVVRPAVTLRNPSSRIVRMPKLRARSRMRAEPAFS